MIGVWRDDEYHLAPGLVLSRSQLAEAIVALMGASAPSPLYLDLCEAAQAFPMKHQRAYTADRMADDVDALYAELKNRGERRARAAQKDPGPKVLHLPGSWQSVLGFEVTPTDQIQLHEVKAHYRAKAMEIHQQHGADHDMMVALNRARAEAKRHFGG